MCRLRGCGFQAGLDSKTGFTIYYSRLPITRHLLGKFKYWESSSYREFKAKNRKKETNEMGRRRSSSIIHTIGPYYTLHFKDSKRYVDIQKEELSIFHILKIIFKLTIDISMGKIILEVEYFIRSTIYQMLKFFKRTAYFIPT